MGLRTYIVPATIAEERRITVKANSREDAIERVSAGKYVKLGRPLTRGFLIVGPVAKVEEADE
jgi:hypothetical protein